MSRSIPSTWWRSAAIGIVVAILFLLSIYGYLALFPSIEASHPSLFQSRVAGALASHDIERAITIARHAVDVYRPSQSARFGASPLPDTVLADVLLQAGRDNDALRHLSLATDMIRTPYPPPEETRKPFYFAPARLELGRYWERNGQNAAAVQNFELARVYADPAGEEFRPFAESAYQAYASQGLWSTALEIREPTDAELERLASADLEIMARVCEGKGAWRLAMRVANCLLGESEHGALAHYLLGRAFLADGHPTEAGVHLEQAVRAGHPHAGYFMGRSLEDSEKRTEAIHAYLTVAESSLYRPFAVARAGAVNPESSNDGQSPIAATDQGLLDQIVQMTAAMRPIDKTSVFDQYERFIPVAYAIPDDALSSCAPFPMLVLWEDVKAKPGISASDPHIIVDDDNDGVLSLRYQTKLLKLEWTENLLHWALTDRLPEGPGPIPCWTDTAMDWFKLRSVTVASVSREGGDTCLEINGLTWFYSVPIAVEDDAGYLVLGRVRGRRGSGGVIFQAVAPSELVISEQSLPGEIDPENWSWQMGYFASQYFWESIRVYLGVTSGSAAVEFDDIAALAITRPTAKN